jgi:hypothetical protein
VPIVKSAQNTKTAVVATRGVECDILIYKPDDYAADIFPPQGAKEYYLFLPPYLSGQDITAILPKIQKFDGIYCDGFYGLELASQMGKPLFAGTGFNLSNTVALTQCNTAYVALSKELTVAECKPLLGQNTFYLSAGDIKVMDLIYCPFGKSCNTCDKRTLYTLTDDEGRKFPLRRYQIKECRFELYNCAKLVIEGVPTGLLFDCSLQENSAEVVKNYENASALKKIFGDFTKGHGSSPVF